MSKDAAKPKESAPKSSSAPASGSPWLMVLTVLLSAVPLTALGLNKTIAAYAHFLDKSGTTLGPIARYLATMGDPGLVAVGMGAALIGVIGAALFPAPLRTGIPVFMMLLCGWATAGVLFLLLPG